MAVKDWNWGAVAAVGTIVGSFVASAAYLESGLGKRIESVESGLGDRIESVETRLGDRIDSVETRLRNRIKAVETRLGDRIDSVETRLGDRIDKVEVSIAAMRTDLEAYERNHNERQLAIENRLTALEVAQR